MTKTHKFWRVFDRLKRLVGNVRYQQKWQCPECGQRNGHELGCPFVHSNATDEARSKTKGEL